MRRNNSGFTLIEIIVVITIMAMAIGIGVSLFGGPLSARLKGATSHLIRTIQFAFTDATSRGLPLRIVFDIDNRAYWLEAASDQVLIDSADVDKKELEKREERKAERLKRQAELAESGEEVAEEAAPEPDFQADDAVIKKVKLPDSVKIRDVFVGHQPGLIDAGQAFLYFFPSGQTEHAVIHLSDEDEETNYTVIVNPVTGRSRVTDEYLEYERVLEGDTK